MRVNAACLSNIEGSLTLLNIKYGGFPSCDFQYLIELSVLFFFLIMFLYTQFYLKCLEHRCLLV